MHLDDEICFRTPRFEDDMSDEERTAGSKKRRTPAVYSYDVMKQALRNLGVFIPHGNEIHPQDEENDHEDDATTNDDADD